MFYTCTNFPVVVAGQFRPSSRRRRRRRRTRRLWAAWR
jgi:hypothetical protein